MLDNLLLSVGAMKAGTTWLHQVLRMHPDIYFSPEKEINYFTDPFGEGGKMSMQSRIQRYQQLVGNLDPERLNQRVQDNLVWYARRYFAEPVDAHWYENLFEGRKSQKYCADFSNLYAFLPDEGWNHVRKVARNVRVIYTFRHPLERMWSHVKFHYRFANREAGLSKWKVRDFEVFFERENQWCHGDYVSIVKRLRNNLDDAELRFQFMDDMMKSPADTLIGIEQFLGVAHHSFHEGAILKRVNETDSSPLPKALIKYAARIHDAQLDGLERLGFSTPAGWRL